MVILHLCTLQVGLMDAWCYLKPSASKRWVWRNATLQLYAKNIGVVQTGQGGARKFDRAVGAITTKTDPIPLTRIASAPP